MNTQDQSKLKITYRSQQIDEDRIASAFAILFHQVAELLTQQEIENHRKEMYGEKLLPL